MLDERLNFVIFEAILNVEVLSKELLIVFTLERGGYFHKLAAQNRVALKLQDLDLSEYFMVQCRNRREPLRVIHIAQHVSH